MEELKLKIEAVLFAVGKEISPEKIASLTESEIVQVEEQLVILQTEYAQRDHSLQINHREDGMWKLTVRDAYIPLVSSIVESTEIDGALMQTLAVIAWKYPVVQSEIVKMRGSSAYEHMRELVEQGFIIKERFGRTYRVRLTKKFFQYFDLPSEEAKKAFLEQVPDEILNEADALDKEIDEVERMQEAHQKDAITRNEIEAAMLAAKSDDTTVGDSVIDEDQLV
ncbi:SMC-Scp complex subunit ScpB [archaeon]|jgi:segregation and condensation protein B|nr:SMC-Scp complex subunit ScpB [archaeon]MBT6762198.1 SMC-Scp complex subunit ScpB [archaeon]